MEELVKQFIQIVEGAKKNSVPWSFDEPHNQPYYHWNNRKWMPIDPATKDKDSAGTCKSIVLYSWNIDFMLPFADSRMHAAVRHLESLVTQQSSESMTVIYLNECVESDLKLIAEDPWIRDNFNMTDLTNEFWQSGYYGTLTLIDKRLPIKSSFRVHYSQTRMERDGLFVDVDVGVEQPLRLCNTHLESLALEPAYRPPQLKLCSQYMHDQSLTGAILAGDLNAIQDFDKNLHSDNDLKDACLELGRSEDGAQGHTWGQQAATAQRERFGTSRMDKIMYCGKLKCRSFDRFGMDVELEKEEERDEVVRLGFDKPWITDHLGVRAEFDVRG